MHREVEDVLSEESLRQFVESMKDFNQTFCDAMADGVDFTIKLEVRGDLGKLLHAKVDSNRFRRPNAGTGKNRQRKNY